MSFLPKTYKKPTIHRSEDERDFWLMNHPKSSQKFKERLARKNGFDFDDKFDRSFGEAEQAIARENLPTKE